jgi:hypothetical protein
MRVSLNIVLDRLPGGKLPAAELGKREFTDAAMLADDAAHRAECLYVTAGDSLRIFDSDGMTVIASPAPDKLLPELQGYFATLTDWYERLHEAVILKRNLQDILTLSEPILGNFISVSDSALSLIAYTRNIATDDPISLFLIENGYHSEDSFQKFKQGNRFETWTSSLGLIINDDRSIAKYPVVSKVFNFGKTYFTHVVMSCNHRALTPGLVDLFGVMTKVMGYFVSHEWEEEKYNSHAYESLLTDLMNGVVTADILPERSRIAGICHTDRYVVMLLDDMTGKAFSGRTAQNISRRFRHIHTVTLNGRLALFLHHDNLPQLLDDGEYLRALAEYFAVNNIVCGMSDIFESLLSLNDAYRQAEFALSERRGSGHIVPFDDCFERVVFDRSKQAAQLFKTTRYGKMLLRLIYGDREKHTNNFDVLQMYLRNDRRALETAQELHMHRNNVAYRVTRIEEMLGIDLEDADFRKKLSIAFFTYDALRNTLDA